MTEKLRSLVEDGSLNELELVEFIRTYQKLVETEVINKPSFDSMIEVMEITQLEDGSFQFDENTTYSFI